MTTYKQMLSTISEDASLTLELVEKDMPKPAADEIVVRVEATPVNPSDHGVMFGAADLSGCKTLDGKLVAPVPKEAMGRMKGRLGQALPVGNEGAGQVVAAGDSDYAQSLLGKTVAVMGGGMYAEYRCLKAAMALPLNEGDTAKQGASSFVNPLTALSMVETMRMEGHSALVHTAAASNLGQMLNRICQADGVDAVSYTHLRAHET